MTDAERITELERENVELRRRLDEALKQADRLSQEGESEREQQFSRGGSERKGETVDDLLPLQRAAAAR